MIKDLAESSAKTHTENFNWDYLPQIDRDIFEKFAELVIEEIIKVNYEAGMTTAQKVSLENRYREHFGIK